MHAMLEIQVHLKTILIIKCCFLDSFAKRSKSKNCRISRDSSQWGSEVLYYYIQCINVLTYIFTYYTWLLGDKYFILSLASVWRYNKWEFFNWRKGERLKSVIFKQQGLQHLNDITNSLLTGVPKLSLDTALSSHVKCFVYYIELNESTTVYNITVGSITSNILTWATFLCNSWFSLHVSISAWVWFWNKVMFFTTYM